MFCSEEVLLVMLQLVVLSSLSLLHNNVLLQRQGLLDLYLH